MQGRSLKKINLEKIQNPKILIVMYYKNKRLSIPIFDHTLNAAQLLAQDITKFHHMVLNSGTQGLQQQGNILCFETKKDQNYVPEHISDGDLKMDIILSFMRVHDSKSTDNGIEITRYYKYMEVQPYFAPEGQQMGRRISKEFEYQLIRLLHTDIHKNVYLARNAKDARFYNLRVYAEHSALGKSDYNSVSHIMKAHRQKPSALETNTQAIFIPENEEESQLPQDFNGLHDSSSSLQFKHLVLVTPYNVNGTLKARYLDPQYTNLTYQQCYSYLKQLLWAVYLLQEKHNLIHRNLLPSNIQLDHCGRLHIVEYSSCVPCYDHFGKVIIYEHNGNRTSTSWDGLHRDAFCYSMGMYTPPEVKSGKAYSKLVDFYSIGLIINQLCARCEGPSPLQSHLLQIVGKLTSEILAERDSIVRELIDGILKLGEEAWPPLTIELDLGSMALGKQLDTNKHKKFVQNLDYHTFNRIDHSFIKDFFQPAKQQYHAAQIANITKPKSLHKSKNKDIKSPSHNNSRERANRHHKSKERTFSSNGNQNSRDKSTKGKKNSKSKSKGKAKHGHCLSTTNGIAKDSMLYGSSFQEKNRRHVLPGSPSSNSKPGIMRHLKN